jgi:hypothetical protein
MRIVLARHGRPAVTLPPFVRGDALARCVRRYDLAPLDPDLPPPEALLRVAADAGCILCSDLPRARDSARLLAPDREPVVLEDLREAALPCEIRSRLPLPLALWVALARSAWLLGWWDGAEPARASAGRAAVTAPLLVSLAERHGTVLAVGHDMFNRLLGGALRRSGWRGGRPWVSRYWSFHTYRPRPTPLSTPRLQPGASR